MYDVSSQVKELLQKTYVMLLEETSNEVSNFLQDYDDKRLDAMEALEMIRQTIQFQLRQERKMDKLNEVLR